MNYSRIEIEYGRIRTETLYGVELGDTSLYLGEANGGKGASLYLMPLQEVLKDMGAYFKSREETEEAAIHVKGGLLAFAYLISNRGKKDYQFIEFYYLQEGEHQVINWEFCGKASNVYQEDTYYWTFQLLKEPLDTIYKTAFNLSLEEVVGKVKGNVTTLYRDEDWYGNPVHNYLDELYLEGESWYISQKYSSWREPLAALHQR